MKLPSAPELMSARPLTVMPAHRRTTEIVVRDLGREEMTVALASTPPSTGELWLLTDMKQQNVHSRRSKGRGDSEYAALVPPKRCEPLPAAWVRGQNREEKIPRLVSRPPVVSGASNPPPLLEAPIQANTQFDELIQLSRRSTRIDLLLELHVESLQKNERPARAHSTHT